MSAISVEPRITRRSRTSTTTLESSDKGGTDEVRVKAEPTYEVEKDAVVDAAGLQRFSSARVKKEVEKMSVIEPIDVDAEEDEEATLKNAYPEFKPFHDELAKGRCVKLPDGNIFGHIPGSPVGTTWDMRMECSRALVHRPPVSGIHGSIRFGAFSIAVSGGYEDDVDDGETIIFTGAGGRDLRGTSDKPKNLRTAPQSKNQELEGVNLAMAISSKSRIPVRVIRGYKCKGPYAPAEGYRYDGLYVVDEAWEEKGQSGFTVWRFRLKRCANQMPPPWKAVKSEVKSENGNDIEIIKTEKEIVPCSAFDQPPAMTSSHVIGAELVSNTIGDGNEVMAEIKSDAIETPITERRKRSQKQNQNQTAKKTAKK